MQRTPKSYIYIWGGVCRGAKKKNIMYVSEDIWYRILSFCDGRTVVTAARVCSDIRAVSRYVVAAERAFFERCVPPTSRSKNTFVDYFVRASRKVIDITAPLACVQDMRARLKVSFKRVRLVGGGRLIAWRRRNSNGVQLPPSILDGVQPFVQFIPQQGRKPGRSKDETVPE